MGRWREKQRSHPLYKGIVVGPSLLVPHAHTHTHTHTHTHPHIEWVCRELKRYVQWADNMLKPEW